MTHRGCIQGPTGDYRVHRAYVQGADRESKEGVRKRQGIFVRSGFFRASGVGVNI